MNKLNHKATTPLRTNRAECTVREKSEKIENFSVKVKQNPEPGKSFENVKVSEK